MQNSVQQDYLPELSPIIPEAYMGNTWDWGRITAKKQKFTHFPRHKKAIKKFNSLVILIIFI